MTFVLHDIFEVNVMQSIPMVQIKEPGLLKGDCLYQQTDQQELELSLPATALRSLFPSAIFIALVPSIHPWVTSVSLT